MRGTLRISDLRFRFDGQAADLFAISSLQLPAGATLGIRGASGAGKTTLLHCLAGIASATAGSIQWAGTDITRLPATELTRWRQRQLGLVFQDFHLVEGLSALGNVLLPACFSAWRASPAQREHAAALLDRVGITIPTRRAELLSRGERQRVAVARALLFSPAVLLADEPTASLDPVHRERIGALLGELAREHGSTLIVISHEEHLLGQMQQVMELREGGLHA
ncbi:MAG: ABC transporter ATP-binding protein [Candidatus Dactylopiibacterium carminicum]|uniref:ABC transporter ATP-binding protein n=1 Tax=Candidatus Dactylopiibacterium carminicum TaxID=857335 RepID=A0A272EP75_9RHOO|nr:ATP-binding cassette domain-containing protein [Candidatus Dactylopiibacterium carminicum]KAF7598289.1 ABC transporter ATP-binding protein [Candidatus Dactylopiibacterium carminicum]PAS91913.1 MAG: ABC transporter ATP-binding protein [Candidatus Dactylopiibacterium carminicum]PAS94969.1 MAG: ABC transporter ATP-binding protein [Candidatus Dactylopiibacterium carminicum]PAS97221.1 MAG: ABC transporter ATP-binding protein [Candidatus Dactylopiibacterium carminicum]